MDNGFSLYREFSKTLGSHVDKFPVQLVKSFLKNLANAALLAVHLEHKLSAQIEHLRATEGYREALAKAVRHVPQTKAQMLSDERRFFAPMRTLKKARKANHKVAQPLVRAFKEANRYLSLRANLAPKDALYHFALMTQFLAQAMQQSQEPDVDPMLNFNLSPDRFTVKTSSAEGILSPAVLWNEFLVAGHPSMTAGLLSVDYVRGLEALLEEALLALKETSLMMRTAKVLSLEHDYEQLKKIRPLSGQTAQ